MFTSAIPFAVSPWRRGKRGLGDVGPHVLFVLLPILGDIENWPREDTVPLVLTHVRGRRALRPLSLTARSAASGTAMELQGETGTTALSASTEGPVHALTRVDRLLAAFPAPAAHPRYAVFGLRVTEIITTAEAQPTGGHGA